MSVLSDINPPKNSQPHIKDIEVAKSEMQSAGKASTDLLGVGIAGGILAFPSLNRSSGMNGFIAVDLLLGSLAGSPTLLMHQDTTLLGFQRIKQALRNMLLISFTFALGIYVRER